MSSKWSELVSDKRRRQEESIPKEWLISQPPINVLDVTSIPEESDVLSAREIEITNCQVELLLVKLASAEWTSLEVTTAFYKRAIIAQQLVNCLTEIFVEQAFARAKELDDHLKRTGQVLGPLHGLPISLKDQLAIKGLETTMGMSQHWSWLVTTFTSAFQPGYASWIGRYASKNAVLVDILYECGAVPFVRTNVPQTLMWGETYNHIFGRTTNPYNRKLTCGGSSGGEAALIALKGSPLGVGSDIGGSIRQPAAFCGLYGLRPSYGRIPYAGAGNSMEGQDSVLSVFGPMSNSIAGVKLFMKAVIERQPWLKDPLAVRKKWDEAEYNLVDHGAGKQLCFAIMWDDKHIAPHPPITRGLKLVKHALSAAGHQVIDWEPFKHEELSDAVRSIWNAGSNEDFLVTTSATGEPVITTMSVEPGEEDPQFRPTPQTDGITAYQLWQVQKRKRDLRKEYLDHWEATASKTGTGRPVDAIICPATAFVACPHGMTRHTCYLATWNALDYAACIFPVSKVDPVLDAKQARDTFFNDSDKAHYESYDPETFSNAPISLSLVGRTLEEEAVIAMTEIVDAAVKAFKSSQ
ncbi:general amidase [Leucogyrophana mollusca]|uniref:General amidase n=1 Tax=Leucogyrophana mollusca TaxID=85980 RepID=A0ACB8BQQ4_9AGAM|nr:general amidase [Leucogyrophana mollusca]